MKQMLGLVAAGTLAAVSVVHADLLHHLNTNAIYGEAVANSSTLSVTSGANSENLTGNHMVGGVGVQFSGINATLWFLHMGLNYGLGPIANGGTATGTVNGTGSGPVSGNSLAFNFRFGKGFRLSRALLAGPYLADQYARFSASLYGSSLTYINNAIGGGVYAALAISKDVTFTGHAGYLVSASSSASLSGANVAGMPGADVLQAGGKVDYATSPHYSLFAGVEYDRYSGSYAAPTVTANATITEVRGMVGLAYHYY